MTTPRAVNTKRRPHARAPVGAGTGPGSSRARGATGGRSRAQGLLNTLTHALGGSARARVIVLMASVLALSSADASTVGASATALRSDLGIRNTQIGLLVSITSLVAAAASLPAGVLADRVNRTRTLGFTIALWSVAMAWGSTASSFRDLLISRIFLGAVTAAAGPFVASLVGDSFAHSERGRIYGYILAGELVGAGIGFTVTGEVSALSWRAAFLLLALPALVLAWLVFRLPEPARGGREVAHDDRVSGRAEDLEDEDAARLTRERGVEPDPELVLRRDPRTMNLLKSARYILRIRTNVILILASAGGYYFLAGVQTFGVEFTTRQYGIHPALAGLLFVVAGTGSLAGVLLGGAAGDFLLARGYLNGRILVAAVSAAAMTVLFIPPIFMRGIAGALPYLVLAALFLAAQNPPLDAARLDVMVPQLRGRAEAVRTLLRTFAQALAPLLFGVISDSVFGGGRTGLQWTFVVMLAPLGISTVLLFRALRTYARDVATAQAARWPASVAAPRGRPGLVPRPDT